MTLRLNGSSSGYTEIDAPAAAGSNTLTLPTGNGSAGQVLSTNGSGVLSFVNAITEVDPWRLTADSSANGVLTSLERIDEPSSTHIGTGMSESSGVFTFPSTGKWLVILFALFGIKDADSVLCHIEVTTDNSSFDIAATASDGKTGTETSTRNGSGTTFHFLDVTDTSQVKVRFNGASISTGSSIRGNSSQTETGMLFIRLGDT